MTERLKSILPLPPPALSLPFTHAVPLYFKTSPLLAPLIVTSERPLILVTNVGLFVRSV